MAKKKIAVVGAGVGGLATAARLASRGWEVDVYEKLPQAGGRANIIEDKGFKFDTGPSFVLMPSFFKEVFDYCGRKIEDYLDLKALDISYKIFYPDGPRLTVYKDKERTKEELEKIEPGSAAKYELFLKETARIYRDVEPLLYKSFSARQVMDPRYWSLLGRLKVLQSYWGLARKYFKTDTLCYAFTFEAMFIGVSPFASPAFYSVITYADHVQKIFHPIGGMYQIPKALELLCHEFGARIHYLHEINRIERSNGSYTLFTDRQRFSADKVVINADYPYARKALLQRDIPNYEYSCSVYLLYLGLNRKVPGLAHHNLFFARDLRKNLHEIFKDTRIPQDPSFYIHVPTVTDDTLAPEGKEIVYILVPVPNLKNRKNLNADYESTLRNTVLRKTQEYIGVDIEPHIEVEHRFYPIDFISRYNIRVGATFGLAHTLFQSAFFRPSNIDSRMKGVYFVGASTQPGGGLPVVIAGSRIVADMITRA